jgi:replicative DNA helicase
MSLEIEHRVLGTLMLMGDPNHLLAQEAIVDLEDSCFLNVDSQELYAIIFKQFYHKKLFDIETVSSLVSDELSMRVYEIAAKSWSTNLLLTDITFLKEKTRKRLIKSRLNHLLKDFNAEMMPDKACTLAVDGCIEISKLGLSDDHHIFTADLNSIHFLNKSIHQTPVLSSGIKTIDSLTNGGFKNKSLITIAGRSGMGKTGFGVHLAHHLAANSYLPHVLFYSLEMSASDIYEKQLSSICSQQISTTSEIDQENAVKTSLEVPFTIHSKPLISIDHIEASARITYLKSPFSVIVVDYLGIVQNKSKFESHALRQADIALRLSALAIELDCIVIALTQVNRDYATRNDKVPITSDAADSSGSERSSSYWLGIYRPFVDDESECENDFVVKCRKSRFGNTWTAYFAFNNGTFGEVPQHIYNARPMSGKKDIDNYFKKR